MIHTHHPHTSTPLIPFHFTLYPPPFILIGRSTLWQQVQKDQEVKRFQIRTCLLKPIHQSCSRHELGADDKVMERPRRVSERGPRRNGHARHHTVRSLVFMPNDGSCVEMADGLLVFGKEQPKIRGLHNTLHFFFQMNVILTFLMGFGF